MISNSSSSLGPLKICHLSPCYAEHQPRRAAQCNEDGDHLTTMTGRAVTAGTSYRSMIYNYG